MSLLGREVSQASIERTPLLGPASEVLANTPVYPLIHLIRVDVIAHIDTPLTLDQLLAPDSTYTILRPLTEKYSEMRNHSIVFCLLLNRVQFTKDSSQLSINTLSLSRAMLCEILAVRVLREWSERTLPLASVLLTPWALFQGASDVVMARAREEGDGDVAEQAGNALEMAVIGQAKRFIKSPSCQKVIDGIWSGRIIYQAVNQHAIISDNYKRKPIQMYNPHRAPLLDHYRLKVPRIRAFLEYINFIILFCLYVLALEASTTGHINWKEGVFIVYAMGFTLDKLAAMREHGLKVFAANLWNGFDLVFILIYVNYLAFRLYGLHRGQDWARDLGTDILAIGAVMMFPRLAFVTLDNNLMILSLRSMMSEFFVLMGIAIFCFIGFAYALWTLGAGKYAWADIGWWLLEVYFGLDATGFNEAHHFHGVLGPLLMITFAMLSNTLLLTVLVAILSNTFAIINADAAAESMFRRAVSTIEGVKADAIFSYQIPFNLLAFIFMYPLYYIVTPRWFHKVNVFMIRASSFPILLIIAWYERQTYHQDTLGEQFEKFSDKYFGSLPRRIKNAAGLESLVGASKDIDSVFEIEKEVGDFYRGWDDDEGIMSDTHPEGEDAVSDEEDPDDPLYDDPDMEEASTSKAKAIATTIGPDETTGVPFPRSGSMPINSPKADQARRRTSMSSSIKDRTSAFSQIMGRRRSNSIAEPSPLAKLFVRSPPVASNIPSARRGQRFGSSASMSMSLANPMTLPGPAMSQSMAGNHVRANSTSVAGPKGGAHRIQPIHEGKTVTFDQAAAPADGIPTASQLQDEVVKDSPTATDARLKALEEGQQRIEALLKALVREKEEDAEPRGRDSVDFDDM